MNKFLLNNQECNPLNREDIRYSINFEDERRRDEFTINVSNLIFVGEDRQRILDYASNYGLKAGMPFDIIFNNEKTQKYYLDLTTITKTPTQVSCQVIALQNTNDFFLNADGLSFRLIKWSDNDFKQIPYVVIPQEQPLYYLSITGISITIALELARAVKDLADIIGQTNEATVPAVGVSPAGPVLSSQIGSIISLSFKITAQSLYIIALGLTLKNNVSEIISVVLPRVRYFKGITYKKLIEKSISSARMGNYTLDSNLLNQIGDNLVILPTPQRPINSSIQGIFNEILRPNSIAYTNGFPDYGEVASTLGSAIDELCTIFNAQVAVNNGVVRIENEASFIETDSEEIRLAYNNQSEKETEVVFEDEYTQRRIFTWTKDISDLNTFDDTKGVRSELGYELSVNPNEKIRTFTDAEMISSNFSLGTRKESLSVLEQLLLKLAKVVDKIANTSLAQQIENRVGVLQLSSQYFQNTKLLWMQGSRIASDHREKLNAFNILSEYHQRPRINEVINDMPILLNKQQFIKFLNKKFITLRGGQEVELISLEWDEINNLAEISYKYQSEFDKNINENVLNNGGN